MSSELPKIPKQFNHWCVLAGLKPIKLKRYNLFCYKGFNRHWRINNKNEFQMSEPFETFDRWANSLEHTVAMPTNKADFILAVERMLAQQNGMKS